MTTARLIASPRPMLRLRTIGFVLLDDETGLESIDVGAIEMLRLVFATSVGRARIIELDGEILAEELVSLYIIAGEEGPVDVLSGREKIAEALPRWM